MLWAGGLQDFAGACGHHGYRNAQGSSAYFWTPKGLCVSPNRFLAVVDSGNACIRKITMEGRQKPLNISPKTLEAVSELISGSSWCDQGMSQPSPAIVGAQEMTMAPCTAHSFPVALKMLRALPTARYWSRIPAHIKSGEFYSMNHALLPLICHQQVSQVFACSLL